MTDIGTAILRLLTDHPDQWEYRPVCEGVRHEPTGISVVPSVPNRVLVFVYSIDHTAGLANADHAPLHTAAAKLVTSHKESQDPDEVAFSLRKVLGIS